MAQFDFLGSWKDTWGVLAALFEPRDITLIPDVKYDRPQIDPLTSEEQVRKQCLSGVDKFLVSSQVFSTNPPVFKRVESGIYQGKYVIENDKGGPLLTFLLPACYTYDVGGNAISAFEDGKQLHCGCGILMYQKYYWSDQVHEWVLPSASVKSGYKEIVRRVKTQLVRHQFHKPIWVGKDALREILRGNAIIDGFGLN